MKTIKIGLVAFRPLPEAIIMAKELGISALPVNAKALVELGPDAALAPLRAAGLEVCQVGAFGYNPLTLDLAEFEAQQALVSRAIPLVPETGCRHLVINGGNYDPSGFMRGHADNFTTQALDTAARRLAPLAELAERHGITLVIEPFIQCAVNTPERYLLLREKVGSAALSVTLDLCNFMTYDDLWQPATAVERICRALKGHYELVHCKDLSVMSGTHLHIDEVPLGKGMIDWKTAMKHIAMDLPADGYFIYEHVKAAVDGREGMAFLRSIATDLGVILS